ncbi:hypothetical protein HMPREF0554_2298 [Pseudoleptotrichia goodfellowii F0264]|jgi:hypothetical protein|uniref:Uncharacterized protein n=1 Tax=Pseudoleptotrichia goodfellowii F0264 TaxID=596323 RepID=D0GN29_9FUSO|nr:hypothetical protein HMPREF0554_2298 [Pseudoleptotrichia goodfellowii F0264]
MCIENKKQKKFQKGLDKMKNRIIIILKLVYTNSKNNNKRLKRG